MSRSYSPENGPPSGEPGLAFPIAGVGASAGGLAATTNLLRHIGSRPGAGIVIVHHLDPTHESHLVEILSRATPLPVQVAEDGRAVEPNRVYVVPPNGRLSMAGGVLHLTARSEDHDLALPIDRFFESLAADVEQRAIGIVLSGSGSDGSVGVRAINAAGGITFAQDASADFRSMPDSAMATGAVDHPSFPRAASRKSSCAAARSRCGAGSRRATLAIFSG